MPILLFNCNLSVKIYRSIVNYNTHKTKVYPKMQREFLNKKNVKP